MDEALVCAIVATVGLFFNFVAYSATINFIVLSNYHESAQSISMVILHLTFTFCSISLSPVLLHHIHPKWVMIMGSVGFLWYISCSIASVESLLYFASFITGIGSSLLLISAQQIIIRSANVHEIKHELPYNSTIGYFEGIILCGYQLSYCVGTILPSILYQHQLNKKYIYFLLFVISLLCPIILGHINHKMISGMHNESISTQQKHMTPQAVSSIYDPIHDDSLVATPSYNTFAVRSQLQIRSITNLYKFAPVHHETDAEATDNVPKSSNYLDTIRLWGDSRLQSVILLSIYWGFWSEFMRYEFPLLIGNEKEKIQISVLVGFLDGILCFGIGKLSDRIHKFWFIGAGIMIHVIVYWMFYQYLPLYTYSMPFYCVIGTLMAIGNALFTTTMFVLYPLFMGERYETFCNVFFWQSLGSTLSFIIKSQNVLDSQSRVIMYFMCVFLCSIPFFVSPVALNASQPKYDTKKSIHHADRACESAVRL